MVGFIAPCCLQLWWLVYNTGLALSVVSQQTAFSYTLIIIRAVSWLLVLSTDICSC